MILRNLSENAFQAAPSMQDMFKISEEINKDFSPADFVKESKKDKDAKLSSQEMLEVSENISLYFSPGVTSNKQRLMLLPVDPQHLYAYWSMDGQSSNKVANRLLNDQVVLRVYASSEGDNGVEQTLAVEVTVHELQSQQRIRLPFSEQVIDYSASIGVLTSEKGFDSLLKSNNTLLAPQKSVIQSTSDKESKPLVADQTLYDTVATVKSHYASSNPSGQGNKK